MEKIDKLRYKIAEMCLRYSEMENTNNEKGQRLLFDIQKLTESFNLIKEQLDYTSALEFINPIQPIVSNNLKYKSIENGYFWVQLSEDGSWIIAKFHNGWFYSTMEGVKLMGDDLLKVGERIEHEEIETAKCSKCYDTGFLQINGIFTNKKCPNKCNHKQ
jgi:hypothetical protein